MECFYKFTDLFRVAQFVVTDRAEPFIHVEVAEEGMLESEKGSHRFRALIQ